ncbi:MAG TPA: class I SAM-dependent methyltransferase [Kofleriaceae bacterium]|nr:class I SAM-dependent methyltransferase [Kofleriaceae bacterium]
MYAIIALLLVDALRMRGRAGGLPVLHPSDQPPTHQVIAAPGVTVGDATLRAASAYMRTNQLDVLDLVPRDLPAIRAMSLLQLVDPERYRLDKLAPGRTAVHAVVASADVIARAQLHGAPADEAAFARIATRLKHFGSADVAIAPDEHARPADPALRFQVLRAMLGPSVPVVLAVLPIMWILIAIGFVYCPIPAAIAFGAWQLQPALALAGTRLHPRDLPVVTLLRIPIEVVLVVRTALGRRVDISDKRAAYAHELEGGTARFFEPRRETCPICDARELAVLVRSPDLLQHKPGTFTLERCKRCGHVFQNPRLSLAGLDFYYKDFYDGLGEDGMEFIFAFGVAPYIARAKMVRAIAQPKRWLDVGAGHGHFCAAARAELPGTTFDGLDFGESIEEAQRRGWVTTAYRGLFPALAHDLAGRYDAVSMSHYLEHTLDPRAEIAAARTALADGGTLMIEVPDPEFRLGRVLRRYWLPWFQPQHQHLLSVGNLEKILREHGFEPVTWHRGAAHQRVDFFFASYLWLSRIAPPTHWPWRKRGALATIWRVAAWTLGSPLIILGLILDNGLGPIMARAKRSNTYRVVARKASGAVAPSGEIASA